MALDAQPSPPAPRRQHSWRRLVAFLQVIVLGLLVLLFGAYVVASRQQPFYGWLAETPIEGFYQRFIPFLGRQRHRLAADTGDSPLLPEERQRAAAILARMDELRPTHAVALRSGEQLFGRLRSDASQPDGLLISFWQGGELRDRPLLAEDLLVRQNILPPDTELTAGDLRFFFAHPELDHYFLPPFAVASDSDFATVFAAVTLLLQSQEDFNRELGPVLEYGDELPHLRVCLFARESDYRTATTGLLDYRLINSLGCYRRATNTLYLYARDPATPANQVSRFADDAPRAIVRHEATHQLAAVLQLPVPFNTEVFWLDEGLAQCFESSPPGAPLAGRLAVLADARAAGTLIPWDELLLLPPSALTDDFQRERVAYAQSWLLVRTLLGRNWRPNFFKWLLLARQHGPARPDASAVIAMMNTLGVTASKFSEELDQQIPRLPSPPAPSP